MVLELDGGQHGAQVEYDQSRTAWLEKRGYRVHRVWNFQIREDWDSIAEGIWRALQAEPEPSRQPVGEQPA